MAADDFTMIPNEVIEVVPDYHNITTQSESMKKEFFNIAATPLQQYKLKFKALTTANKDVLLAHYKARYGGYDEFTWITVPAHIESGTNITGRWVDGSLDIAPIGNIRWACTIVIEKSI